jgi:hypothetical protein
LSKRFGRQIRWQIVEIEYFVKAFNIPATDIGYAAETTWPGWLWQDVVGADMLVSCLSNID